MWMSLKVRGIVYWIAKRENLIARVSPLELDRALGTGQVKLRVPISFGLK